MHNSKKICCWKILYIKNLGWTCSQIFKCLKYLPKSSTNIRPTYPRDSLISTQLFIKQNIGTRITANHPESKIVMMRWWYRNYLLFLLFMIIVIWLRCGSFCSNCFKRLYTTVSHDQKRKRWHWVKCTFSVKTWQSRQQRITT